MGPAPQTVAGVARGAPTAGRDIKHAGMRAWQLFGMRGRAELSQRGLPADFPFVCLALGGRGGATRPGGTYQRRVGSESLWVHTDSSARPAFAIHPRLVSVTSAMVLRDREGVAPGAWSA